jgi:hypothetical protein
MVKQIIVLFSFFPLMLFAQAPGIEQLNKRIDAEQERIDLYDGALDGVIGLGNVEQAEDASTLYFEHIDQLQELINRSSLITSGKTELLGVVYDQLSGVDRNSYRKYTRFSRRIDFMKHCLDGTSHERILAMAHADPESAAEALAFISDFPFAESLILKMCRTASYELLRNFKFIAYEDYAEKVLIELASRDPMRFKDYLAANNHISSIAKRSTNDLIFTVKQIYQKYATNSRAYLLLQPIHAKTISLDDAHEVSRDEKRLFNELLKIRSHDRPLGDVSLEKELHQLALKQVRVVNDLHNEANPGVRFASVMNYNARELYTLMVYSQEEIFTSSFLEMNRMLMQKMKEKSSYEFLFSLGFNRFRQWMAMCAGFNKLDEFLARMSAFEKQLLFERLLQGLDQQDRLMKEAVAVADIYGSLNDPDDKELYRSKLFSTLRSLPNEKREARILYGLLTELCTSVDGGIPAQWLRPFKELSLSQMFPDGQNIQQHFFYDDPDGYVSFSSFIAKFSNANWQRIDSGTFVIIKSRQGKNVSMLANKPQYEAEGHAAIIAYFERSGRWPDVVVHRGHSYYARIAIETLTPSTEVVFLGSCGGYHIVNEVLERSPDASIISSKQIGTLWVNNDLIFNINESLRKGKPVVWKEVWNEVGEKLNSYAKVRFKEYVAPDENLGAILIRTYRERL